jgi:hypothetical protein
MKKSPGWRLLSFLILTSGTVIYGCAPYFTVPSSQALLTPPPPIAEKRETTFLKPDFSYEDLKSGGMALLAILTPGAPEGLRQNAAFEIFQGLRSHFPDVRIVPRSVIVGRINTADKTPELNKFLKIYEEQRSVDPGKLKEWGEIEEVRYLFIGQVRFIDKHTEAPIVNVAERSPAGKVTVFSSGPNQIPDEVQKRVSLSGELWDSRCGKVVWTGKSDSEVVELSDAERVRVEDIFIAAGRNLTEALSQAVKGKVGTGKATC